MSKCICAEGRSRAHSCLLLKKTFCHHHSDGSALRWLGVLTGLCQSRISALPFKITTSLHPFSHFFQNTEALILFFFFVCLSAHILCFLPIIFFLSTVLLMSRKALLGSPSSLKLFDTHRDTHTPLLVIRMRDRQQQVELLQFSHSTQGNYLVLSRWAFI